MCISTLVEFPFLRFKRCSCVLSRYNLQKLWHGPLNITVTKLQDTFVREICNEYQDNTEKGTWSGLHFVSLVSKHYEEFGWFPPV